jgi:hypothetical protein
LIENVKAFDRGMRKIKEEIVKVAGLFSKMWEVL